MSVAVTVTVTQPVPGAGPGPARPASARAEPGPDGGPRTQGMTVYDAAAGLSPARPRAPAPGPLGRRYYDITDSDGEIPATAGWPAGPGADLLPQSQLSAAEPSRSQSRHDWRIEPGPGASEPSPSQRRDRFTAQLTKQA